MRYKKDQKVKITNPKNDIVDAIIIDAMEDDLVNDDTFYWVEWINEAGEKQVDAVSESWLNTINSVYKVSTCTCGSDKLGHPGHDSWCDKIQKIDHIDRDSPF